MNLFSSSYTPLAHRLRPEKFSDVVGQNRVVKDLEKFSKPVSLLFYGPPGSGKTTLATILAKNWKLPPRYLSAIQAGVKEVREVFQEAERVGTILLFLDEIHRFTTAQQDSLLDAVETGKIILVGATSENPGFRINRPLLSRLQIFRLESLDEVAMGEVFAKAMRREGKGRTISDKGRDLLISASGNDARKLLTTLEALFSLFDEGQEIELETIQSYLDSRVVAYDRNKESHYDITSAFIKSMRGSDPDAALLYMTYMLAGGEDPVFIARRMIVFASEDIGNASVHALPLALSALTVVEKVGMPEAEIALAQVITFLASCPKSNASYSALHRAKDFLKNKIANLVIPNHLRNSPTAIHKKEGASQGYHYPHEFEGGFVEENYFPDEFKEKPPQFYYPSDQGMDSTLRKQLDMLWSKSGKKNYSEFPKKNKNPT